MPLGSERPVALITGAARRVGRACAEAMARSGFDLLLTYHTSGEPAEATAAFLADTYHPCKVELARLDLGEPDRVERFGASLASRVPRLDVLIHNASIYGSRPLAEIDSAYALDMYRVNALAPLLLSRFAAPFLSRSPLKGGGAIVALCDMHALGRPRREMSSYAMSKAALVEMVRSLARELAPGVRVNGVAPGVVGFPENGPESDAGFQAAYVSRVPLGRTGTSQDAAEAVRWLAMDAAYTTGEIVRVDGGRWLA